MKKRRRLQLSKINKYHLVYRIDKIGKMTNKVVSYRNNSCVITTVKYDNLKVIKMLNESKEVFDDELYCREAVLISVSKI